MIPISDKDLILLGWIHEESERIGRPLVEGLDYEIEYDQHGNRILLTYYSDPDKLGEEPQVFEITDTPVMH